MAEYYVGGDEETYTVYVQCVYTFTVTAVMHVDWIECCTCTNWFDLICANLVKDEDWGYYQDYEEDQE